MLLLLSFDEGQWRTKEGSFAIGTILGKAGCMHAHVGALVAALDSRQKRSIEGPPGVYACTHA